MCVHTHAHTHTQKPRERDRIFWLTLSLDGHILCGRVGRRVGTFLKPIKPAALLTSHLLLLMGKGKTVYITAFI